jgi:hypothetical protein
MVYILGTLLRKALKNHESIAKEHSIDDLWKSLMLTPFDYGAKAIFDEKTRKIMEKITF